LGARIIRSVFLQTVIQAFRFTAVQRFLRGVDFVVPEIVITGGFFFGADGVQDFVYTFVEVEVVFAGFGGGQRVARVEVAVAEV